MTTSSDTSSADHTESDGGGAVAPFRIFVDTSEWLNLAKDVNGQKIIDAIRVLAHQGRIQLLVPQIVIDEFSRNRERIAKEMTTSVAAQFRRIRTAIVEHGQAESGADAIHQIDDLSHQIPLMNEMATRNFNDIHALLEQGTPIVSMPSDHDAVVKRALEKLAPFHRNKNSVADALLIEMYARVSVATPSSQTVFISANTKDFSSTDGDARLPHPDFDDIFSTEKCAYSISLATTLGSIFSEEYEELIDEFDYQEVPRKLSEILSSEQEFFDRIWYNRSLGHELMAHDQEAHSQIAGPGRARVEAAYGLDSLGPYSDFEWGMLNGKLSALRWVLGSEWDFLDT